MLHETVVKLQQLSTSFGSLTGVDKKCKSLLFGTVLGQDILCSRE